MTRIEFGSKLEEARKHNDFISMHNLCKEYYKEEGERRGVVVEGEGDKT